MYLSHALADGVGRGLILSRWAQLCRGARGPRKWDSDRGKLIELAQGSLDLDDSTELVPMEWSEVIDRCERAESEPCRSAVVKVEASALREQHARCVAAAADEFISVQDVLTALIWQRFAEIQDSNQTGTLSHVLDFRRCFGISETYIGNVVTDGHIEYEVADARTRSTTELALRIRQSSRDALTSARISRRLSILWRYRHLYEQRMGLVERAALAALSHERLHINNLSRFPVRDLDFGTGPPFWVTGLAQPAAPSVGIFPLSAPGEEGYALHIMLGVSRLEKLLSHIQHDPLWR